MLSPWVHFAEISPLSFTSRALLKAHPDQYGQSGLGAQLFGSRMLMPPICTILAETSPQESASCFAPHVRPLRQEAEPRSSIWLSPLVQEEIRPRAFTHPHLPPISRPSMTWNPRKPKCNKSLFSIILTGASSFPSLAAFFPWLTPCPTEQISAAYTAPDILGEDPGSLSL